jgi:hypothetical protein
VWPEDRGVLGQWCSKRCACHRRGNSRADVFSQSTSSTLYLRAPYKNATSFGPRKIILPNRELFYRSYFYVYPGNYPVQHGTLCCWLDYCNWGEESSFSAATKLYNRSVVFIQVGRAHPSLVDWNTDEGGIIARFNKSLEGQI